MSDMTIDLYTYTGLRKKVNKTMTTIVTGVPIRLLEDTDIVKPVIEIEYGSVGSYNIQTDEMFSANYARITDFGRYYFIDKKEIINQNIFRFYLSSDPLSSFTNDVVNWEGIVEFINDNDTKSYLNEQLSIDGVKGIVTDSNCKPSINGKVEYNSLNSDTFKHPSLYLVSSGYNPVSGFQGQYITPLSTGFINMYTHGDDMRGIQEISHMLWSLDPVDVVTSALFKPIDAFISLHLLPFRLNNLSTTKKVNIGYLTQELDNPVSVVGNTFQSFNLGNVTIIDENNTLNFKYYEPFRYYKLYLPYLGFVDINPNTFLRQDNSGTATYCEVNIVYNVNLMTGDFSITLRVPERAMGALIGVYDPKEVHNGNMASRIPLTAGNAASLLSGASNVIGSGVLSSAAGVLGSAGSHLFNGFTDMANTFSSQTKTHPITGKMYNQPYNYMNNVSIPSLNQNTFPYIPIGGMQKGTVNGNSMYMGSNNDFWYDVHLFTSRPAKIFGPYGDVQGYPFASKGPLTITQLMNNFNLSDGNYVQFRNVKSTMSNGMTTEECDLVANLLTKGVYL